MAGNPRLFRALLRILFPEDFRAAFQAEMARTFSAQQREARRQGRRAVLALWLETLGDLARTAPRQHLDQLRQDVRHAARRMRRHPGMYALAALVLALGIASTTAIFSVVDATLLRPVPFDEPERLVAVNEGSPNEAQPFELSYPTYLDLRRESHAFEQLAAYTRNGVVIGGADPRLNDAALISSNLLESLRVRPVAGRGFSGHEDAPGGPDVVLLREALARERFGTPEGAIGQPIDIDRRAHTVVGVLPGTFRFPDPEVEVWLPIGQLGAEPWMRDRAVHVGRVVGRLRRGATLASARAELTAWMDAQQAREPKADPGHRLLVRSFSDQLSEAGRPAVAALSAAVLLLLVVTCSSVGLLLLTAASGRGAEVGIRLSLGATRGRLTRQFLTETALVAAVATAAGVLGAKGLLRFFVYGLADSLPPLVVPSIDLAAMAAAVGSAGLAALLCGAAPAAGALALGRRPPHPSRHRLVIAHVAVACVLVVVAVLLVRSLDRVLRVDPGFRTDHLLLMRVTAPIGQYEQPGAIPRFFQSVCARVRELPGVVAVTAGAPPPFASRGIGELHVEGQTSRGELVATFRRVLPGYFGVLGVPLVEGRDFTARDGAGEPVVIVSEGLARRFWPRGRAVGNRIKVGSAAREPWLRVIGVVDDVRNQRLETAPDLATYEPHAQRPWNGLFVMVRTAGEPAGLIPTVQRAIRELEPQALFSEASTMEARVAGTIATRRFYTVIVGAFACATVLLVALAIYGALAHSVASRTREIGIRAAVGASPSALRRVVIGEGLRPTLVGLALGMAGGVVAAWSARAILFEITPKDLWTYAVTAALFLLVLVVSSWMPALRAARIDPSTALRAE